MNKRSGSVWLLGALAALAVATSLLLLLLQEPDPVCGGKTLTQWLLLLDSATEHKAENDAVADALGVMRDKALPRLIRILRKREPPPLITMIKTWAVRLHLIHQPALQLREWQYRAARACCILGGWNDVDIRAAIPELAYHLTNSTYFSRQPFAWGLVYSGPEGLSIVTNLMAHAASPRVREEAAGSLWISPKIRTAEIAGALIAATHDPDANVRLGAILTLQSFARQDSLRDIIATGALHCLKDDHPEVRRWTVQLMSNCTSAPGVEAALRDLSKDPEPAVQEQAEKVLQGLK